MDEPRVDEDGWELVVTNDPPTHYWLRLEKFTYPEWRWGIQDSEMKTLGWQVESRAIDTTRGRTRLLDDARELAECGVSTRIIRYRRTDTEELTKQAKTSRMKTPKGLDYDY